MMEASKYMLVPVLAITHEGSMGQYYAGFGYVNNTTVTRVFEKMTYVPNHFKTVEYSEFNRIMNQSSIVEIKSYTYLDKNVRTNSQRATDVMTVMMNLLNISKGNGGIDSKTTRYKDFRGWSSYPESGFLNGYRPGGTYRPK